MITATRERNMLAVVTPFDEISVQKCLEHQVDILKVASCSATDWPLLEAVAEAGKPVIISTAGITIPDIDRIVSFFNHRHVTFALLHCVGIYPTPVEKLNLNLISKLVRRYPGVPIGYSGHEAPENVQVVSVAVSKGATILERHVGFPTESIALNAYSLNPEQTNVWVKAALEARVIAGDAHTKTISEQETASLRSLMRGVFAQRDIPMGSVLRRQDVFFAMPCGEGQTSSGEFGRLRAKYIASRDYKAGEAIVESASADPISIMRSVIHEARGLLNEAAIMLDDNTEFELSHHYGMERFREVGAVIVNVINREYCKKLVVVLPRQMHPIHSHKVKEETFQLLWGDLHANLNGTTTYLQPGDKVLVERGTWHSFTSEHGAVFEEISTTHVQGDSFYEDEDITALDPMQRKTILKMSDI
jgi:N-acetylneuraminate synthase